MTYFGSVIQDALRAKYAGCEYVCGETYESLQWLDKKMPKPTVDELTAAVKDYVANQSKYDYAVLRAQNYPSIATQLDMLWSAIDSGVDLKSSDFYTSIKAVKDKYPKG